MGQVNRPLTWVLLSPGLTGQPRPVQCKCRNNKYKCHVNTKYIATQLIEHIGQLGPGPCLHLSLCWTMDNPERGNIKTSPRQCSGAVIVGFIENNKENI